MIVMQKTRQVVDIWSITAWRDHPRSRSLLTAREHRKAHAFRCPETANRWSYFHSAAREILAAYTGTPASELVFAEEEHGKPYLPADRSLYFNLSHSLSSALLAVCRFAPVGVDIEHRRALSDMDRLARRCFSTPEYTAYQAAESALREQIFFRLWTRKEAVIKASGLGLHQPLQGFDVPAIEMPSPVTCGVYEGEGAGGYYLLAALQTPPAYAGALALECRGGEKAPSVKLQYHRYRPGDFEPAGSSVMPPRGELAELCTE